MVDLLGRNSKFEPMWDAIRSMRNEGVLSLATFVSVFETYCYAGRVDEAIISFDVLDRCGIFHGIFSFLIHCYEFSGRQIFFDYSHAFLICVEGKLMSHFVYSGCTKFFKGYVKLG